MEDSGSLVKPADATPSDGLCVGLPNSRPTARSILKPQEIHVDDRFSAPPLSCKIEQQSQTDYQLKDDTC